MCRLRKKTNPQKRTTKRLTAIKNLTWMLRMDKAIVGVTVHGEGPCKHRFPPVEWGVFFGEK